MVTALTFRLTVTDGSLSDADGDGLTYTWYRGSQVGTGSILTQALSARGTFTYTLRVQDDHGGWDEDTVAIKVR